MEYLTFLIADVQNGWRLFQKTEPNGFVDIDRFVSGGYSRELEEASSVDRQRWTHHSMAF